MFDELEKYKSNGHFFIEKESELKDVCNAPKSGVGVYVVYALKNGRIDLIYIGSSGKVKQDGSKKIRVGGMYDRLVNGTQFNSPRRISWIKKIEKEELDALDVYWYETFDRNNMDIPTSIEGLIIQRHFETFGKLPKWNKEF